MLIVIEPEYSIECLSVLSGKKRRKKKKKDEAKSEKKSVAYLPVIGISDVLCVRI
jgi:hypothetical protein